MLPYYIQLAFRNLRNKVGFYAINIAGLAIGIAACLMITHYVRFHKSYDTYQEDSHRVYRINYSRWTLDGDEDRVEFASATPIIGKALLENIPEIEMQGQAFRQEGIFSYEDKFFEESKAFYAESDLLRLLGVIIKEGPKENVLDEPRTLILSESTARKYFGDQPAIGKTMYYNKTQLYEVVGIFSDIPPNSHFKADMFLSIETWKQQNPNLFQTGYIFSGFYNYIKLREETDPELVNHKAAEYVENEYGETLAANRINMGFKLQPLEDIHLHSHFMHELELNGNASSIAILEIIAWFILIIAWVNFFNLSTITSIRRLREICIRKVNGAARKQLLKQLLSESALVNLFAILIALILFEGISPYFFNFADLPTDVPVWNQSWIFIFLIFAFIAGTLSAGVYSITGIPSSKVAELIKGGSHNLARKRNIRKILVTAQFIIAIGLIASTTVIFRQYQLISKVPLGFKLNDMLVLNGPLINDSISFNKFNVMKKEVQQLPEFNGATFSSVIPGKPNMYNRGGVYIFGEEPTSGKNYRITEVDESFAKVYNIKLIAGEDFTGYNDIDREKILVNASAARFMGFSPIEEALGKRIVLEQEILTISGIINDFHQLSPKEKLEPQIFRIPRRHRGYLTIDMSGTEPESAIKKMETIYQSFFPANPFAYFFLDNFYEAQNIGEKRFSVVLALFSILVILITVLGLMGLSAYTVEQRRKEIAIRKVLGAKKSDIFRTLFKDYILLWILGGLIALPLAYYFIDIWLNNFALRIQPGYLFFILPILIVIIITLSTVFIQSTKVLHMNPSESIKAD
jgi:putative ABC transport system permease protein